MINRYLPSKIKFGVCVIGVILFSGCASPTRAPMDPRDLSFYHIDCSREIEQVEHLESMRPGWSEKFLARAQLQFLGPLTSDYDTKLMMTNGAMDHIIEQKIILARQSC
jgi:hypothetical protein